ncbi:hypothetical protein Rrhod_2327 [Rhodococcus rhodnii LMG 5362]|uniref:Uncharacterized protein n=1 Tax=Rhodococcus rhodnii LMG 5362 TaxID=1273125 RepID=R7WLY9_9NOCA|nr:hypothetical protein Rrhod_2327 [Rhodococcus rhodnii LMG 5362]
MLDSINEIADTIGELPRTHILNSTIQIEFTCASQLRTGLANTLL